MKQSTRTIGLSALCVLLAACSQPLDDPDTGIGQEELTQPAPSGGKVVHEEMGEELYLAVGAVMPTGELPVNGVGEAHYFEDGTFVATAQVNVLPVTTSTIQYEVWLVNDSGDRISIGNLASIANDARHFLKAEIKQDLRAYTTMEVTQKEGAAAATTIASADLIERKR